MPGQMFADIPSLIAPAAAPPTPAQGARRGRMLQAGNKISVFMHTKVVQPAGWTTSCARETRFTLAQHAQRGDPRRTITEIGGMPEKDNELLQMDVLFTGGKGP